MKRRFIFLGVFAFLLVLSNYFAPYINMFTGEGIGHVYVYSSADEGFTYAYTPTKGASLETMHAQFEDYREEEGKSNQLYRRFTKQPLKFWNWYRYSTHPMYDYPFMGKKAMDE